MDTVFGLPGVARPGALGVIPLAFFIKRVPETKDRSLEDLEHELRGGEAGDGEHAGEEVPVGRNGAGARFERRLPVADDRRSAYRSE